MLNIVSTAQIVKSFQLAQSTNTEGQLIKLLLSFDNFGDGGITVDVCADNPLSAHCIVLLIFREIDKLEGKKKPFCRGKIIYDSNSNLWNFKEIKYAFHE